MRIYIAGPMTGLPAYNFPAFHAAAAALAEAGHEPINPADTGLIDGWVRTDYLRHSLKRLVEAEGVALLDGWERSGGATMEVRVAMELGLVIRRLGDWIDLPVAARVSHVR